MEEEEEISELYPLTPQTAERFTSDDIEEIVKYDDEEEDDSDDFVEPDDEYGVPLSFVLREEWGALLPKSRTPFKHPVRGTVFAHSESDECSNKEECIQSMQLLQKRDMESGMPDIQYNWYIGGDLSVYEGRGWDVTSTQTTDEYADMEHKLINVCYIGRYAGENYHSEEVMDVNSELLQYAVENGYLRKDFNNYPTIVPLDYPDSDMADLSD